MIESGILKLIVFLVGSACLIFISRASLRAPRSHGFYRFFAWELILALFLLNIDIWFRDPLSRHQLLSWAFLCLSLVPLVFGVHALARQGKAVKNRPDDPQLLDFEKTTTLVTTGIYRYIRHPLYCSLLLLTWGIFFKQPVWSAGLLALAVSFFLIATAKADESECLRFFGQAYQDYIHRSKMFIPFLW
jgi:protein-S-isoprenylcysteine O-methyltransferase Ste14